MISTRVANHVNNITGDFNFVTRRYKFTSLEDLQISFLDCDANSRLVL